MRTILCRILKNLIFKEKNLNRNGINNITKPYYLIYES